MQPRRMQDIQSSNIDHPGQEAVYPDNRRQI